MIDIISLVGILIIIFVIVMIFKLVKSLLKAAAMAVGFIFIILIVLFFFIIVDANNMNKNFGIKESLFVYENDKGYLTGVSGVFGGDELNYLNSEIVDGLNEDINKFKDSYYKIFIFRENAFDNVDFIEIDSDELSREEALSLIESDNVIEDIKATALKGYNFEDVQETKGLLFDKLLKNAIDKDKLFLFREYKKRNMDVYPQTIVFKIVELFPESLTNKIIKIKGAANGDS